MSSSSTEGTEEEPAPKMANVRFRRKELHFSKPLGAPADVDTARILPIEPRMATRAVRVKAEPEATPKPIPPPVAKPLSEPTNSNGGAGGFPVTPRAKDQNHAKRDQTGDPEDRSTRSKSKPGARLEKRGEGIPKALPWLNRPEFEDDDLPEIPIEPAGTAFKNRPVNRSGVDESGNEEPNTNLRGHQLRADNRLEAKERASFGLNWRGLKRSYDHDAALHEAEVSKSQLGRASRARMTSWLFRRGTLKLELTVIAGLLIVVATSLALWWIAPTQTASSGTVIQESEAEIRDKPPIVMGPNAPLFQSKAKKAILAFYRAASLDELAPLVRDYERDHDALVGWLARRREPLPIAAGRIKLSQGRIEPVGDQRFLTLQAELPHTSLPRTVLVEITHDGLFVDWRSAVNYQELEWETLMDCQPQHAVELRAKVKPDSYFNYQFADRTEWMCYRLEHPNEDRWLYAYTRRRSLIGDQLVRGLVSESDDLVVLKVRFPEVIETPNMLLIEAVVSLRGSLPATRQEK